MPLRDRIEINPKFLVGKPVVRGTRLSVEHSLELMAEGWSEETILREHPGLAREDLLACIDYALDIVRSEQDYRIAAA